MQRSLLLSAYANDARAWQFGNAAETLNRRLPKACQTRSRSLLGETASVSLQVKTPASKRKMLFSFLLTHNQTKLQSIKQLSDLRVYLIHTPSPAYCKYLRNYTNGSLNWAIYRNFQQHTLTHQTTD